MPENHTDIDKKARIIRRLPQKLQPYGYLARLDRPIGTWLLFIPCLWGIALALPNQPQLYHSLDLWVFCLLFALGATVMRGAGCCWNDIADRDFDGKVVRTQSRPIPSGAISVRQALIFLLLLCLVGLIILLQFNLPTIYLGAASLFLVVVYPFMKRLTWWPQAWLGLTFNYGILVGWSALEAGLSLPVFWLYGAGIFWTLGYDTIYAHQDKEDDALIGVKSSARLLGKATKVWLVGFYGLTLILIAFAASDLAWFFWAGYGVGACHLLWQINSLDIHDPANCLKRFQSNRDFGLIIALALFLGGYFS